MNKQIFYFRLVKRAVPEFGKRGGVCIVLDKNRQPEPLAQYLAERHVVPFEVRRDLDRAGFAVDQAGNADTDDAPNRDSRIFRIDQIVRSRRRVDEEIFWASPSVGIDLC